MKYYITKTEKRLIISVIVFLMILNIVMCFKGMALMQRYTEVVKEKEALEEIIEVQKQRLEEI